MHALVTADVATWPRILKATTAGSWTPLSGSVEMPHECTDMPRIGSVMPICACPGFCLLRHRFSRRPTCHEDGCHRVLA